MGLFDFAEKIVKQTIKTTIDVASAPLDIVKDGFNLLDPFQEEILKNSKKKYKIIIKDGKKFYKILND